MSGFGRWQWSRWLLLVLAVVAILIWVAAAVTPQSGKLRVSFLDVGQGDAILIITPAGQNVLIDGGPSSDGVCNALGNALPFWDRKIDLVVLTHPHDDHVTGLVEVLKRYDVEQVLYPEGMECTSGACMEWLSVVDTSGIRSVQAQAGQYVDLGGGALLEVLHPSSQLLEGTDSDADNNGIVIHISIGDVSFLLAADMRAEGEQYLVERGAKLASTVLKVAHHGSETSTNSAFLAAVSPQAAVVSVGADNPFGHPSGEVMERLAQEVGANQIFLTSEDGSVTFTTDGKHLWVRTWR